MKVGNLYFVILASLLISCGKDSSSSSSSGTTSSGVDVETLLSATTGEITGIFSSDILQEPNTVNTSISASAMLSLLEQNNNFYLNNADPNTDTDGNDCISVAIDALTVQSTSTNLVAYGSKDITSCLSADDNSQTYFSGEVEYLEFVRCVGADFSAYNGKTYAELQADTNGNYAYCLTGDAYLMSGFKYTESARTGDTNYTSSIYFGQMGSNGNACSTTTSDGVISYGDGCVNFSLTTTAIADGNITSDFALVTTKSVQAQGNELYYSSGSMDANVDNWSGTITFAGSDPNYVMTSSEGVKVSGVLPADPNTSLNFVKSN